MNDEMILDGIRVVLRDHVGVTTPVSRDTQLVTDLELDSLKQLTLVVELENHFRIRFAYGDEDGIKRMGDLLQVIKTRMREQHEQREGAQ